MRADARSGSASALDLVSAAQQAAGVVEAGARVGEPLLPDAVRLLLGADERLDAQDELVRGRPDDGGCPTRRRSSASRRSARPIWDAEIIRSGVTEWTVGDLAQLAGDLDAVQVGKVEVHDHRVGAHLLDEVERLSAGVGLQHHVTLGTQDALDRAGGPLLVVDEQDQRCKGRQVHRCSRRQAHGCGASTSQDVFSVSTGEANGNAARFMRRGERGFMFDPTSAQAVDISSTSPISSAQVVSHRPGPAVVQTVRAV